MKNALFIYLGAINALKNMLGQPWMNFTKGGITINLMIGNFKGLSLVCRNIFLVIFQWQATMGFWMMVTTKKEKITRNKHYCYYHYTRITFSSYPYFNLSVIVFTNSYYRSWTLYNLYLEQRYTLLYRNLILYICLSKQNFYKVF